MNKKILLVDDASFMRMVCKDFLTKNGFEVVGEAGNGLECLEMYKSLKPDLVLLDIAMPEYDGKWALTKLMEHDPQAKIIMLSAVGHARAVVDCLKLGACDFIVKPFNDETVIAAINKAFEPGNEINPEVLEPISALSALSGDNVLPQNIIYMIIHTARTTDDPSSGAMETIAYALKSLAPGFQAQNISPSPFAADETPALLRQLIQGQEKMVSLLNRLVEEKG